MRIVAHYSENERQLLLDRNEPVELVEDDGFVPIAPLVGDTPNVAWQDESGDEESLVSITLDQDDSDIDWNDFLLHIHHHPEAGRQT